MPLLKSPQAKKSMIYLIYYVFLAPNAIPQRAQESRNLFDLLLDSAQIGAVAGVAKDQKSHNSFNSL